MNSTMAGPARTRIAPSPTGFMHVGTARTAVFDWLLARASGGRFILRVEDTDRKRYVEGATEALIEGLDWLGIRPDEGPGLGGEFGPYTQSERLPLYVEHAARLVEAGHAYRCFCGAEDLAATREARREAGLSGAYDRRCRQLDPAESLRLAGEGRSHVIRLAMPLEGEILVHDLLRGLVRFDAAELEDAVLLKSDGFPTYQLAVVIDDHRMAISHVLRGEEWIPSAPIQVRLYAAFGWQEPVWVHLPLVLRPDGRGKLSKRDGGAELLEYRERGYLPEAMFNYLALLGWRFSGETEVFDRARAVAEFDIAALQTSHARWDADKLDWLNGVYIRALSPDDLAARLRPFLERASMPVSQARLLRMVPLVQERLVTLADAVDKLALFWADAVSPDPAAMIPKQMDAASALALLESAEAALGELPEPDWNEAALEACLRLLSERSGVKLGPLLQPLRLAVTGLGVAPPMFGTLELIGRETSLARMAAGRAALAAFVSETEPSA